MSMNVGELIGALYAAMGRGEITIKSEIKTLVDDTTCTINGLNVDTDTPDVAYLDAEAE